MMTRDQLESDEDRAAWDFCQSLDVDPFMVIPAHCEPRFRGFELDYFMNWAREKVEEALAMRRTLAANFPSQEQP